MEKMFYNCPSLISLDLSNINTSLLVNTKEMLYGCTSLTSLKLFSSSKLSIVDGMFYGFKSLITLDLFGFNTSSVKSMKFMFYHCYRLNSLNLSSFDTSSVTDMKSMFQNCHSLKNLNISNFDTSNVIILDNLFSECNSLEILDLSNFDTSKVTSMRRMFYQCSSLISLDSSNFNTSIVKNMMQLFDSCSSIKNLNLSNFKTSSVLNMFKIFNNCKSLLSLDISNFNLSNNGFLDDMFNGVSNLKYINMYNLYADKPVLTNLFSQLPEKSSICIDEDNEIINDVFLNIKKCIIVDCTEDFNNAQKKMLENEYCVNDCNYIYNKFKYKEKCYKQCPNGTISSSFDKYICIENLAHNFSSLNIFIHNNIPKNYKGVSNTLTIINAILNDIEKGLMNSLTMNIIEKKEDLIVNYLNMNYQLTTSFNQENNKYDNITSLHLGDCENILKDKYNISKTETLLIFKLENFIEGITIPILTYEVINPKNNKKLDLKYCDKEKIIYKIPVLIDEENMFLHDPNNSYYNNICSTKQLESGVDITLYDRKNEYNNNNLSLCETKCIYQGYNPNSKKVLCSCPMGNKSPLTLGDIIDQKKLLDSFINIKSKSNIGVMKCYKL